MNPKNTPRDFFIHVGAFATLYFAAIALITLLFNVIDYAFPDALEMYYYGYQDPYSGPMRFAIASLIVLIPIFVYLMRMIQRETRANPERRTIGVRKWLTYITLFIAGATVIGDLIALLNSFLGGTLATTFVLKALVIFLIMGAGFGYFLLDIRGYWLAQQKRSEYAGYGLVGVVLISIVGGFLIMGSPMAQREIRFDNQQVQDLQLIQGQLVYYWQQNGRLPEDLSTIESDVTGFMVPDSPEGRPAYTYTKTGDLSFELCAAFAQSADTRYTEIPEYSLVRGSENWNYEAGEHCFERTIDPELIPQANKLDPMILNIGR